MVKIIKEAVDLEFSEFIDQIDFDELSSKVSGIIGAEIKLVPSEPDPARGGGYYIKAESEDIVDKCGVFRVALSSVKVHLFDSLVRQDRESGKFYFRCAPHFRYESRDGGSNGLPICNAMFTVDHGWTISK